MAIIALRRGKCSLRNCAGGLARGMMRQASYRERSQFPHHVAAEAVDDALAGERHELHVARLPGLEPSRGPRRDVEPHAACAPPVELQRRIGLEEMIVRADLDRPIASIGY